jgi:hypothetical protein
MGTIIECPGKSFILHKYNNYVNVGDIITVNVPLGCKGKSVYSPSGIYVSFILIIIGLILLALLIYKWSLNVNI